MALPDLVGTLGQRNGLARTGVGSLVDPRRGSLVGSALSDQGQQQSSTLTDDEAENLLWKLARSTGGAIEQIGRGLDTPGAILRGVLAGKPTSGFSWDYDTRVSGEELLESYGLLEKGGAPSWKRTGAGLAAEIALDPLSMIMGPMRSLTAAGKAAKAAGILDKASDAYLAQKGIGALQDSSRTAKATMRWIGNMADKGVQATPETLAIRPLVGPRVARTKVTLDDVVKYADQGNAQQTARQAVDQYLESKGMRYADVAGEKLGGAMSLGYFKPMAVLDNIPGGEAALDLLDRTGQALMWNPITRRGSAMFDKRVADSIDAADQLEALKHAKYVDDAAAKGREVAARHTLTMSEIKLSPAAQRLLGADSLLSKEGNDFLTRMFENTYNANDNQIKQLIGNDLDKALASWKSINNYNIKEGQRLGMVIAPYADEYGVRWTPRKAAEADFGEYGKGLNRSIYNTKMLEQYGREDYLKTLGGTLDIRELSMLPKVREFAKQGAKSQYSIAEVGQEIRQYLIDKHSGPNRRMFSPAGKRADIGQEQAEKIASFMQRTRKNLPDDVPMFSEHPLTAQARGIVSQHMARANANYVYDSLAEAAIGVNRSALGGRMKPANAALTDIARQVGLQMDEGNASGVVEANLRQAIGKRLGQPARSIDLSQFSVPEPVYDRLTRINAFYNSPRAQQEVFGFFDKFSQLFKGFVLAWPSRFVRDMYSNAMSIWFETGDVMGSVAGLSTAKAIIRGQWDVAAAGLKQLPQYANLTDAAAIKQKFVEDAARSGVLQSLASNDLLTANRTGAINQLVPGAIPMRRRDAIGEFASGQNWKNFFQIKDVRLPWQKQAAFETKNPLLNASQKMSDFTDSVGRLGGYIALLKQGVTPDVAAQRITSALVDYGSLTTMERQFFRNIFPWWAYNSRIGKYVVQSLIENPGGRYAQTIRALNTTQQGDKESYIPSAIRQQFAFRLPDEMKHMLGINPETDTEVFFRDIDVPAVDVLSLGDPQRPIAGTAANLMNQVRPELRSLIELGTGYDFFSRRPIDEAITPTDRIYMNITKSLGGAPRPLPPAVRAGINMVPGLQRPLSLVGGLMDERLPFRDRIIKQGINTFSGIKRQDADPQWVERDAIDALAGRLRGYTRTTKIESVPKELVPFLPPEKQQDVALQKYVIRKGREREMAEKAKKRMEQFRSGVD